MKTVNQVTIMDITLAVRVKGVHHPYEGKLVEGIQDEGIDISLISPDLSLVGIGKEVIESVWFTYRWISFEEFQTLQ